MLSERVGTSYPANQEGDAAPIMRFAMRKSSSLTRQSIKTARRPGPTMGDMKMLIMIHRQIIGAVFAWSLRAQ
jgi:hypothetical protein